MMLFLSCRKYLRVQLKLCSYVYAIPVCWDSKKSTFSSLESYRRSIYEIVVILHCTHVCFLLCNAVYHEEHNMSTKLIKWNSTMLLVSSAVFHIGSWEKRYGMTLPAYFLHWRRSKKGIFHPVSYQVTLTSYHIHTTYPNMCHKKFSLYETTVH